MAQYWPELVQQITKSKRSCTPMQYSHSDCTPMHYSHSECTPMQYSHSECTHMQYFHSDCTTSTPIQTTPIQTVLPCNTPTQTVLPCNTPIQTTTSTPNQTALLHSTPMQTVLPWGLYSPLDCTPTHCCTGCPPTLAWSALLYRLHTPARPIAGHMHSTLRHTMHSHAGSPHSYTDVTLPNSAPPRLLERLRTPVHSTLLPHTPTTTHSTLADSSPGSDCTPMHAPHIPFPWESLANEFWTPVNSKRLIKPRNPMDFKTTNNYSDGPHKKRLTELQSRSFKNCCL